MSITFERVQAIVADVMGAEPEDIEMETTLAEDLGMDDLDAIEFVMGLEEEFEIEISDEQAEGLFGMPLDIGEVITKEVTIRQVVEFIDRYNDNLC